MFRYLKCSAICVDQCCARVSPGIDPGTGKISQSVLEPEPKPPKALGQFQNVLFLEYQLPPLEITVLLLDVFLANTSHKLKLKNVT